MKDYEQRLGLEFHGTCGEDVKTLPDGDLGKANWDTEETRSCVSLVLGKEEPLQELL